MVDIKYDDTGIRSQNFTPIKYGLKENQEESSAQKSLYKLSLDNLTQKATMVDSECQTNDMQEAKVETGAQTSIDS